MGMAETSFDTREKEEEARFKHREELEFRVRARRNKLLGLWAAEHLGYGPDPAEEYAKELVASALGAPDGVFAKLSGDFSSNGVNVAESQIRAEMDRLEKMARVQVLTE